MAAKKKTRNLSIFLIKQAYEEPEKFLDQNRADHRFKISISGHPDVQLFLRKTKKPKPAWLSLFDSYIDLSRVDTTTATLGALLLMKVSGRNFAITFGTGRYLLNQRAIDTTFGLRATVNSIDTEKVRTVDKRTFGHNPLHERSQANREVSIGELGINIEEEIVRSLTAVPEDASLGRRITGIDSVSIRVPADLSDLPEIIKLLYERSQSDSYKETLPWIDYVGEVRDPNLRDELFTILVGKLNERSDDKLWAAVPDIVDWEIIDNFSFGEAKKFRNIDDLTLEELYRDYDGEFTLEVLKKRHAYAISAETETIRYKWNWLNCLNCELEYEENTYVLSNSVWYEVERDFVRSVEEYISKIEIPNFGMPDWPSEMHEDRYNKHVSETHPMKLHLLDRKLIRYERAPSSLEFCDLLGDKTLIFVKRYGGSSVLSHLFAQALVTGILLLRDAKFRDVVNRKLLRDFNQQLPIESIRAGDYSLVFLVGSEQMTSNIKLPFFSKLTLKNVHEQLTKIMNFDVRYGNIVVDPLIKKPRYRTEG